MAEKYGIIKNCLKVNRKWQYIITNNMPQSVSPDTIIFLLAPGKCFKVSKSNMKIILENNYADMGKKIATNRLRPELLSLLDSCSNFFVMSNSLSDILKKENANEFRT